jgi:hypothetical protein
MAETKKPEAVDEAVNEQVVKKETKTNQVAKMDAKKVTLDKITDDGKKHKQGDVVRREAFGVIVETKF